MKAKLLAYCREQTLFRPGETVICGVSGGADSVAMLHCLHTLAGELDIRVEAAHFDHLLRGEESQGDRDFVLRFCKERSIPLHLGEEDVAAYAKGEKLGLEEAARHCRYRFFSTLEGKIATAHTADDNAETVLMHLLRGSGLRGLCGISPLTEKLCRPLLCVSRQEVLDYLQAEALPHREDSSNKDLSFTRNRLRHTVLPLLREEQPKLSQQILKQSALLRAEDALLDQLAGEYVCRNADGSFEIPLLLIAPDPLQKRALRLMAGGFLPQDLALVHICALQKLLYSDRPSASVDLPMGLQACRSCDRLIFRKEQVQSFKPCLLRIPGVTELPEANLKICCEIQENFTQQTNTPFHFALKYDIVPQGKLSLRPRSVGDRLQMPDGHSKSLKKLMIEKKIPKDRRDHLPVFLAEDRIAAVAGLGCDPDFRPQEGECALLIHIENYKEK